MRVIVVVEGYSEEAFVRQVLRPHLENIGVLTSATIVGKLVAQQRGHRERGGGRFRHWKRDIVRILGSDRSKQMRVTTLFDLYGLPEDFPGLSTCGRDPDTLRRRASLEAALAGVFQDTRFIPYIQRHEFEALVLASLASLRELLDADDDLAGISALDSLVSTISPENVNDGKQTAPSKRLLAHIPGYNKTLHGPLAIEGAGLTVLRSQCPGFDSWLTTLESLSPL